MTININSALILKELERNRTVSYNNLWKKTKIPHGTFAYTMKRLKDTQLIIYKPEINSEGKQIRVFYSLNELPRILWEYWNIHIRIKSGSKLLLLCNIPGQNIKDRIRKAYLLYLLIHKAAFGVTRLAVGSHFQAGDVGVRKDNFTKDLDAVSSYSQLGVAEIDLISSGHVNVEGAFSYIDFGESEVRSCFNKLRDNNIIKPLSKLNTDMDASTRFMIADSHLNEFIKELYAGIFSHTSLRMERTWLYFRWPASKLEAKWYLSHFGIKRTFAFVKRAYKQRNNLNEQASKVKLASLKHAEEYIKIYDKYMLHHYHDLMSKKYHDIHKQYWDIIDQLIRVGYPDFLRKLQNKNQI